MSGYRFAPSRCPGTAAERLDLLISPTLRRERFFGDLDRLRRRFSVALHTCPAPLPAHGLTITDEIRRQCELYLPLDEIRAVFFRLYRTALTYAPLFSSTPFHQAPSWADVLAALPTAFQKTTDPACLLEAMLAERSLLIRFLFSSFLPERFYGGFGRYRRQADWMRNWLAAQQRTRLRCLDVACGTGEGAWDLAELLQEAGYAPGDCSIEGWTIEPLEVWAAAHGCFPHDPAYEAEYRQTTDGLVRDGWGDAVVFACADVSAPSGTAGRFDLIVCNGLLGGPILHRRNELAAVMESLAGQLATGGVLLAADRFHDGWRKKCPQDELRALFESQGLASFETGEGIGGLKPHQQPAP